MRASRLLVGAVAGAALGFLAFPRFCPATVVKIPTGKELQQNVGRQLSRAVSRALPAISVSGSTGYWYTYDDVTGLFRPDLSIAGELFLERADPIGQGRTNLGVSASYLDIETLDGRDLDDLSYTDANRPLHPSSEQMNHTVKQQGKPDEDITGILVPRINLSLETEQLAFSITHGFTPNLDVNVILSLLHTRFRRSGFVQEISAHNKETPQPFGGGGDKVGFGDMYVRLKYRVVHRPEFHASLGLVTRLPTGNEDNFQGSGAVEIGPMLYLSSRPFVLGKHLRLIGHANTGTIFHTEESNLSEGRYAAGVDLTVGSRTTLGLAFLGRSEFGRVGGSQSVIVDRDTGAATGEQEVLLPKSRRRDIFDLSAGLRFAVWDEPIHVLRGVVIDRVIAFGDIVTSLNDDGARAAFVPIVGLEATF